jgi:hypothetical protein
MQDWSPPEGLFDWHVDEKDKVVLPYREPKPCKPIPMKNVEDIIKGIERTTYSIGIVCE